MTDWMQAASDQLSGGREDRCEFGHDYHDRIQLFVQLPGTGFDVKLDIFNWFRYETPEPGYCTGKDEVSKGIQHALAWEADESKIVTDLLQDRRADDIVIDCGAHIGWYTLLAMTLGYPVLAIDADPEHLDVLRANAERNLTTVKGLYTCRGWVGPESPVLEPGPRVRFLKLDLEGSEREALRVFSRLEIDNILLERTPGDPQAADSLTSRGYIPHHVTKDGNTEVQHNIIFTR